MQNKLRVVPDQRFDLENYDSLLSFIDQEFDNYNKAFFAPENFILKNWVVEDNGGLQIRVNNVSSSFLFNTQRVGKEGINFRAAAAALLTLNLSNNATNYVEVQLQSLTGFPDTVAIWDPTANAGVGEETTQTVDTRNIETPVLVSNTTAFTGDVDKLPLAIVVTSAGLISTITDARNVLFHVATDWSFGSPRTDKTIESLKSAFDALATSEKEMKGTSNWYDTPYGTSKVLKEYQNFFFTGGGDITWDGATLAWTGPIKIEVAGRSTSYTLDPASMGVADGQCIYVVIPEGVPGGSLPLVLASLTAVPLSTGAAGVGYKIQTLFFRRGVLMYGILNISDIDVGNDSDNILTSSEFGEVLVNSDGNVLFA